VSPNLDGQLIGGSLSLPRCRDRDGRDLGWGLWHSVQLWCVKRGGTVQRVWLLSMRET